MPVTFLSPYFQTSSCTEEGDTDLESTRKGDSISNEAIKFVIYVSN